MLSNQVKQRCVLDESSIARGELKASLDSQEGSWDTNYLVNWCSCIQLRGNLRRQIRINDLRGSGLEQTSRDTGV